MAGFAIPESVITESMEMVAFAGSESVVTGPSAMAGFAPHADWVAGPGFPRLSGKCLPFHDVPQSPVGCDGATIPAAPGR
jgi:hypothetical protein